MAYSTNAHFEKKYGKHVSAAAAALAASFLYNDGHYLAPLHKHN
jgi:hypothetical protein